MKTKDITTNDKPTKSIITNGNRTKNIRRNDNMIEMITNDINVGITTKVVKINHYEK